MQITKEINLVKKAINSNLETKVKLGGKTKKISIYFLRNDAIDLFTNKIENYLSISNYNTKFIFSDYNDSLKIPNKKYDLIFIWLDYTRYKINKNFFTWIRNKFKELKKKNGSKIVINSILLPKKNKSINYNLNKKLNKITKDEGIIFYNYFDTFKTELKKFWDIKRSKVLGTKISFFAQDILAKEIGLKLIPSIFEQKLKAIIFDLDNTLYNGIVGEDGVEKIKLTKEHKIIESNIKNFVKNGMIVSICTKNNSKDLNLIFKKKILNKKLFFPIENGWYRKSEMIQNIQKKIKVSFKNILFIDDNINEVLEVKTNLREIKVFHTQSPADTLNCLKFYPNLYDFYNLRDTIAEKRVADLKSEEKREKLKINFSNEYEYLKKLKMITEFQVNSMKMLERVFSLSNKVNQFIFDYKRFDKEKIKKYLISKKKFIITYSLKDFISDSGNIGVTFATIYKDDLYIDDICISCRALGREIENTLVFEPIKRICRKNNLKNVVIKFKVGEKNEPAINYIKSIFKIYNKKFHTNTKKLDIKVDELNKIKSLYTKVKFN